MLFKEIYKYVFVEKALVWEVKNQNIVGTVCQYDMMLKLINRTLNFGYTEREILACDKQAG